MLSMKFTNLLMVPAGWMWPVGRLMGLAAGHLAMWKTVKALDWTLKLFS